ncbi:MAG: helix-turn-helix domain-containing protein [Pseudomonadota bacterium]
MNEWIPADGRRLANRLDDRDEKGTKSAGSVANAIHLAPFCPRQNLLHDHYERHGQIVCKAPEAAIFLQGSPASFIYMVLKGHVRCSIITPSGRRHIVRFFRTGDLFGFEDFETRHSGAEAIDHVTLRRVPRGQLDQAIQGNPSLEQAVRDHICRELRIREKQIVRLAHLPAEARVASFIKELASQQAVNGEISLPMSRVDIADYLGLTVETVSRSFSTLRRKGVIQQSSPSKIRLMAS